MKIAEGRKGNKEVRKNFIRITILYLMTICLSSCTAPENGGTAAGDLEPATLEGQPFSVSTDTTVESGGEDNRENDSTASSPEPVETPQETLPGETPQIDTEKDISEKEPVSALENPLAAYRRTVEKSGDGMSFCLINLDGDEIPELVVTDNAAYSIYTVKDGEVFCMVDSYYTVSFTYFEGKGVIAGFDRWNGGGDEGGYGQYYDLVSTDKTLTGGETSLLSFEYNAVYDENGEYTGEGVTKYFYMGQEIDEAAYREFMDTLGISEDGDIGLENLVSAEEILEVIQGTAQ